MMAHPLVVHCKRSKYDVYVGRPGKWGNPFTIGQDGNRDEVIRRFEAWIKKQPKLIQDAKKELKGKILGCWCAPLPCHAEILVKIANESDGSSQS